MNPRINSVQAFLRTLTFIITMIILEAIAFGFLGGLRAIESTIFSVGIWPLSILNLWIAGTISRMFYILPEWERMVLLRLGKFSGVKGPGFFIVPPIYLFSS